MTVDERNFTSSAGAIPSPELSAVTSTGSGSEDSAPMKTIPLSQGKIALVDDEDFEFLSQFKWRNSRGYAIRHVKKGIKTTSLSMHRQVMCSPTGKEIDHADGNTLNNQKSNLRPSTHSQNLLNGKHHRNHTGFKGVFFNGKLHRKPFGAKLRILGKVFWAGYFQTAREAAKAYNDLALEHCGEYARLNIL